MLQYQILDIFLSELTKTECSINNLLLLTHRGQIHYNDVIMGAVASQITCLTIVYSTVYSGADQRKHQSSAPLAFLCEGIHRSPVNSPHKGPVARKMFPFDDIIMDAYIHQYNRPSLLQKIACYLFRAKPLPEPVMTFLIARFMGPTWGPSGADRTQVGPMLAPWTLLSVLLLSEPLITNFSNTVIKV